MSELSVYIDKGWVFYIGEDVNKLDAMKCGKWMYFFNDIAHASEICKKAVMENACAEVKHSYSNEGVCCFYVNRDDVETHKKVISFFLKNNLIKRTKTGKLYNISFKLNSQTSDGEYGSSYNGEIKLDQFVNLKTGEWID